MPIATNVIRRHGIYHFRCRIPADLVGRLGRCELWRSLKTSDPAQARQRASRLGGNIHELWTAIRMVVSPEEAEALVRQWLVDRLAQDRHLRANPEFAEGYAARHGLSVDKAAAVLIGTDAEEGLERWQAAHRAAEWSAAAGVVDAMLKGQGLEISAGSPSYRLLCQRMTHALAELEATRFERSEGDPGYNPLAPTGAFPEVAVSPSAPKSGIGLSVVSADYLAEKNRMERLKEKRVQEIRGSLNLLEAWFGAEKPIGAITKKDLGGFRTALTKLPPNYTKRFPGMLLRNIVEAPPEGISPMKAPTINGHLAVISGMFAWAVSGGLLVNNPALGVRVNAIKTGTDENRRGTFKADHLRALFSAPLFTGCKTNNFIYDPGKCFPSDWRYWLPLIGLFTGARIGEICQLRPQDVRQEDGVWCLDIVPGPGRTLKTKASKRLIPLHQELLRLGLPAVANFQREKGSLHLLEGVSGAVGGYPSHYATRWAATFLKASLGAERRRSDRLVFHSFRHTMEDFLREAGVDSRVTDRLMGHKTNHVSEEYGDGFKPPRLFEALSKINVPVDLSHLKVFEGL